MEDDGRKENERIEALWEILPDDSDPIIERKKLLLWMDMVVPKEMQKTELVCGWCKVKTRTRAIIFWFDRRICWTCLEKVFGKSEFEKQDDFLEEEPVVT